MPTESRAAYLDSSALVKLAMDEGESHALRRALEGSPRRVSSRISVVEVLRAVRRQDPTAEPLARGVLTRVGLMAVSDRVLVAAGQLDPPALRSMDAIHLASALRLGSALTVFFSYDAHQLEAAARLGLLVESPR